MCDMQDRNILYMPRCCRSLGLNLLWYLSTRLYQLVAIFDFNKWPWSSYENNTPRLYKTREIVYILCKVRIETFAHAQLNASRKKKSLLVSTRLFSSCMPSIRTDIQLFKSTTNSGTGWLKTSYLEFENYISTLLL